MSVPLLTPRSAREQRTFRALLNAMARPGTVDTVELHPQGGRLAAAVSILESVLDHEVSFAVVPEQADVVETLLRLTGSHHASPQTAAYLLCEGGSGIYRALESATEGTPEYPDRGATVVAAVDGISTDRGGERLTLAGPGIPVTRAVRVEGLTPECRDLFMTRNQDVPMGIDLVLVAPDGRFTCLSRYTRLIVED